MEKKEILNKYKDPILSALNLALDAIKNIKDLDSKEIDKSEIRYFELKKKIESNEDLSKSDYSFLSMICLNAGNHLAGSAKKLLETAEDMKNLSKAFIS